MRSVACAVLAHDTKNAKLALGVGHQVMALRRNSEGRAIRRGKCENVVQQTRSEASDEVSNPPGSPVHMWNNL